MIVNIAVSIDTDGNDPDALAAGVLDTIENNCNVRSVEIISFEVQ